MRRLFKFIGLCFFLGAFCILLEFVQLLAVHILLYEFFLPVTILAWIFHFDVLLYLINRDEIPEFRMPWLSILLLLSVIGSFGQVHTGSVCLSFFCGFIWIVCYNEIYDRKKKLEFIDFFMERARVFSFCQNSLYGGDI